MNFSGEFCSDIESISTILSATMYIWGYMCVIFYLKQCVRFSPQDFHIFPGGFVISAVRNFLLGLTPENFLKFEIFPGESSSPHRRTETGCVTFIEVIDLWKRQLKDTLEPFEDFKNKQKNV